LQVYISAQLTWGFEIPLLPPVTSCVSGSKGMVYTYRRLPPPRIPPPRIPPPP
jgi:hypothetical protein